MTSSPVLGPVVFSGFEVPERISIGGKQKLVIHTMPGGGRIVDAMGPDDAPIRWSGIFSGPNAAERVRTLDRLRDSGSPLQFAWDAWLYQVIIQAFTAEVENANWIPYQIELCVLPQSESLVADWLSTAVTPALTVATLTGAALTQQIATSGSALATGSLAQLVAASGQVAQYVTSWAYSGATA
jgi:hypothetical protein